VEAGLICIFIFFFKEKMLKYVNLVIKFEFLTTILSDKIKCTGGSN